MIDHIIILYKNYDLLKLQIDNFKKRFTKPYPFNLIVVDNTPNNEKKHVAFDDTVVKVYASIDSVPTFDGISHGRAIDLSLQLSSEKIVCISDSDFFWLDSNIYNEAKTKILTEDYKAIGTEYNDGTGDSFIWRNKNPKNFDEIPCPFGAFYSRELAISDSWVITPSEVEQNKPEGFVEVGYKIRKKILSNGFKTMTYKTLVQGIPYTSPQWKPCFFHDEKNKLKGVHYVGSSHANYNGKCITDLQELLERI